MEEERTGYARLADILNTAVLIPSVITLCQPKRNAAEKPKVWADDNGTEGAAGHTL